MGWVEVEGPAFAGRGGDLPENAGPVLANGDPASRGNPDFVSGLGLIFNDLAVTKPVTKRKHTPPYIHTHPPLYMYMYFVTGILLERGPAILRAARDSGCNKPVTKSGFSIRL